MSTKDVNGFDGTKLPINQFKLDQMVENPAIVMVAKRGSGKSVVCRAILQHFRKVPVGLIIAPTDRMNAFYSNFFPSTYVFFEYKTEILSKLFHRQQEIIEKYKKAKERGKKIDPRAFIIMDDCLGQKGSWAKDANVQELMYNGRHYKLMYILTMQYPLGITPDLRSNFDYIFLLAEDTVSNLKRYYEHYAGVFPDFNSFKQVFSQLTADYGCMVVVNRGARSSFLEKVFWYKAPFINDNKLSIGCDQFNEFHNKNYNKEWARKHKTFNIDDFCKLKKNDRSSLKVDKRETEENE